MHLVHHGTQYSLLAVSSKYLYFAFEKQLRFVTSEVHFFFSPDKTDSWGSKEKYLPLQYHISVCLSVP